MVSVVRKVFVVSDWFHEIRIYEAETINQAVTEFFGTPAISIQDQDSADAFASELTHELKAKLQSKEHGEEQFNELLSFTGTKYFKKFNP